MKPFFIEAIDTLFFRDGRPFEVGGEANLQVPPAPSTFYGAIRSALIAAGRGGLAAFKNGGEHEFKEWVGEDKDSEGFTARLTIKGPLFARKMGAYITRFFPLPRDLLIYEEKEKVFLVPTKLKPLPEDIVTNHKIKMLLINPYSQSAEYRMLFLSEKLFQKYLSGGIQEPYELHYGEDLLKIEDVYKSDFREGVSLKTRQKNAETGRLFTMQHMALKSESNMQMGFYVECEIPEVFQSNTLLRLGGDGKVAQFQPISVSEIDMQEVTTQIEKTKFFKIYLATPAIFELGDISQAMFNKSFDDSPGLEFELITAALGRGGMYGGYDVAVNVPKVSFPAVPAGSVFYFRLIKGSAEQVLQAFHEQCISDRRKNQGFGYSFVGGINHV
ncbi:MAG: hypothetical protein GXO78_00765 [Calditrichaeota bacterium]|nr:hypothetical protein [Calditrichota bacterium]